MKLEKKYEEMEAYRCGARTIDHRTLIGHTVKSIHINQDNDCIILETDNKTFYLSWVGDCCASCYIEHISGVEALIGAKIESIQSAEWTTIKNDEDNCEVLETMGTNLKTSKGHVTLETRLNHNGCYAGYIQVSDIYPMDAYNSARDCDEDEFRPLLEDF